ncbi:9716_t:CDS:2 [Ambispora gerdemannii]|uniref:9716_t:CDS:1 n=1 Tax=Ambispora gerdemannii TaxID=144530 RepID=A0A9N9CSR9_9GLOM|nr:9716_t:CDS:2 [Ambispora gerdemannii]
MAEDQSPPSLNSLSPSSSPIDGQVNSALEGSFVYVAGDPEIQTNGNVPETELSDGEHSSTSSETSERFPDEEDTVSLGERVAKLRTVERQPFTFPTNFRILYVGSPPTEVLKQKLFLKFVIGLSDIFWEEANSDLQSYEIKPEKKSNIDPISNFNDPNLDYYPEYYPDSGVAISEADYTNRPFEEALSYLHNQFQKKENDDDLVDLCIFFIPTDVTQLTREVIPFMKRLKGKVTIFPVIASEKDFNGYGIFFKNECEEKRRSVAKCFEDNNIDIFIWKDDGLIQDRNEQNELLPSNWVETNYTKKVLTVEEFAKMNETLLYEDLKLLRERSLEMRKDRQHDEMVKKRVQTFEWFVEILRTFTIVSTILYTIYLVVFGVWSYAEWSVMSSDLRDSLHVVSSATSRLPFDNNIPNLPSGGNNINYDDTSARFEVLQLSQSRFVVDTFSRRGNEVSFEVIVKHNPQLLRRYEAVDFKNGKYEFNIDVSGAKGDVFVEVWEKDSETVRVVKWSPDKVPKPEPEVPVPNEDENDYTSSIIKGATDYATIVAHNLKHRVTPSIQIITSWTVKAGQHIKDNAIHFALSSQYWAMFLKEKFDELVPTVWDMIIEWGVYLKTGALSLFEEQ